jgi:hypothetical protein
MTAVGPVSAIDRLRAERKFAPFRTLEEPPSSFPSRVTFTQRDLQAHKSPPLQFPVPEQISLRERLDLDRLITDTGMLVTTALSETLNSPVVTTRSYLQAQVRAYT